MRFSAIRHALRTRSSSSTDTVIDPSSFFQSIPLSPLPRRLPWVISMGESAMKFKVKREAWRRRNLSENNAFGYFGHTASRGGPRHAQARNKAPPYPRLQIHPAVLHGRGG